MAKDINFKELSADEMIKLLEQQQQTISEAKKEVKTLSLQKDKTGLPNIKFQGKVYASVVHSAFLPSGDLGEGKIIVIAKLEENTDEEVIEELIKKEILVEVK